MLLPMPWWCAKPWCQCHITSWLLCFFLLPLLIVAFLLPEQHAKPQHMPLAPMPMLPHKLINFSCYLCLLLLFLLPEQCHFPEVPQCHLMLAPRMPMPSWLLCFFFACCLIDCPFFASAVTNALAATGNVATPCSTHTVVLGLIGWLFFFWPHRLIVFFFVCSPCDDFQMPPFHHDQPHALSYFFACFGSKKHAAQCTTPQKSRQPHGTKSNNHATTCGTKCNTLAQCTTPWQDAQYTMPLPVTPNVASYQCHSDAQSHGTPTNNDALHQPVVSQGQYFP